MVARDGPAAVVRATGPLGGCRCSQAMVRERPNALGRLHALWTLELLSSLEPGSIELGLADPEPRVREAAIRLAEDPARAASQLCCDKALALADDPDPMVRFQLAFSLGEVKNDPRVLDALASIAGRDAPASGHGRRCLARSPDMPLAFLDVLAKRRWLPRQWSRPSLDRRAGVSGRVRAEAG